MIVLAIAAAPLRARGQKFLDGLWLGVEDGGVIELIAWAETVRYGAWRMANGSLEDAPVIPRTYRILNSMPEWRVVAVVVTTTEVFIKESERVEMVTLPFSATRLSTTAFEIGIPALEQRENVVRMRKNLKANEAKPMFVFLTLTNGTVTRMYPFRVDRPEEQR